MAIASSIHFTLLALIVIFLRCTPTFAVKKTYIVYLGTHQHGSNPTEYDAKVATQSHYNFMRSVMGSYKKTQESLLHSYNKYINGFVAKLTEEEVERIKTSSNVISVLENQRLKLTTTRSWEFLGLEQNGATPIDSLWNISGYGSDVIIANIDSGVWPESKSFDDEGFGPIPSRWKGKCIAGSDPTFKCNKKLIGARYFYIENNETQMLNISLSPRDTRGHGTHTLSTAGGNFVKGVDVYGFGKGIAKGGSPNARVAAYTIVRYETAELLAAFEAAIDDGVDVLSIQSHLDVFEYKYNALAIGSFHAVRHGITVVASAGNDGRLGQSTVSNIAPWIFTIAASTIDREFYNEVYLGNSTLQFKGAFMGPYNIPNRHFYPLIDGASAAANSSTTYNATRCLEGSLDPSKVKEKIVVCESGGHYSPVLKGNVVQAAGGVAIIVTNTAESEDDISPEALFFPASQLSYKDGQVVLDYINKTTNPTSYISEVKTVIGSKPAPMMARFSSRGPSALHPHILKPDVIAPGVNIIAANIGAFGPSIDKNDTRRVEYFVMSGTSMSAPHVSGIVGLVKSVHPDWSPADIRSAIMTIATTFGNDNKTILDANGQPATPFACGAGHVNPNIAAYPGLVYNLTESDYLDFLCSLGSYTEKDLKLFTQIPYNCTNSKSILDFNYPSITVINFTDSITLKRTVTNVGKPGTYEAKVTASSGVNVTVTPSKLSFNRLGEEQQFSVELKAAGKKHENEDYVFGNLVWSDGTHNVRSPLVVQRV